MSRKNIHVVKTPGNEESADVLAAAVIKIADGFEALLSTPLKEKAIIALLLDMPGMAGVGKRQMQLVLENLRRLKAWYVK